MMMTRGTERQRRVVVARARAVRVTALAAAVAGLAALAAFAAVASLAGCSPDEPWAGTTRSFDTRGGAATDDAVGGGALRPAGKEVPVGASGVPRVEVDGGQLALEVCADNIIRVQYARDEAFFG